MGWDLMTSVIVLVVLATSFTIAGGLKAVMVTDSFQSILMIAGAGLLALIAFSHLDSWQSLANVTTRDTPPELTWKLFHPSDAAKPWYAFILGYPVLAIGFWCSDQTIVQRALGAKDLRQAQLGILFAGFLKILPPFIFLLPGIFAAVLLPGIEDDKQVFLAMVSTYLPSGLVGLIIAVLAAAVISTLNSGLNSFSTIYTLDVHRRWIAPDASDAQLKTVGRVATLCAAVAAVGIVWLLSQAQGKSLFDLLQGVISYMAPPITVVFLLGILWRRATATAALVTLVFGSIASISIGICDIANVFADAEGNDIWPHFLILSFLIFCGLMLLMVITSLLTQHSEAEAELPSVRQAHQAQVGIGRGGLLGMAGLAAIMVMIYLFFQFLM